MREEPNLTLLDRADRAEVAAKYYQPTMDLLEEVVNYGSNLIPRIMTTSDPSMVREIAVGALVKQALQMLDGIHVLASVGAVGTAKPLARSLLETAYSFEWMLKDNELERARAYYVWNLRQERHLLKRALRGTPEEAAMREHLESTFKSVAPALAAEGEDVERSRERIREIDEKLDSDLFRDLDARYEEKRGRLWEVDRWHAIFEVTSVRGMAKDLEQEATYSIFYNLWSRSSHASSYREHFVVGEGGDMLLTPIRSLSDASALFNLALTLAIRVYRLALRRFRPAELPLFKAKYEEEWREKFRSVPSVREQFVRKPRA
jgi:aminoglycoside phosphotransferase (APT) family kinase protein